MCCNTAGHLVTVTSTGEQSAVYSFVPSSYTKYWIALEYSFATSTWNWQAGPEAGQQAGYTYWDSSQPYGAAYCVMAYIPSYGDWWNYYCTDLYAYVIEYECAASNPCGLSSTKGCVNLFNGHYYEVREDAVTWTAAKTNAAASTYLGMTGHLVSITSLAEQQFVMSLGQTSWIGASDTGSTKGNYSWAAGPDSGIVLSSNFSAWAPKQPDNAGGTEDCIEIIAGTGGNTSNWNDLNCNSMIGFIIEYECNTGYVLVGSACIGIPV